MMTHGKELHCNNHNYSKALQYYYCIAIIIIIKCTVILYNDINIEFKLAFRSEIRNIVALICLEYRIFR